MQIVKVTPEIILFRFTEPVFAYMYYLLLILHSFVNLYTANVGRMTNSNSVISTNAYEPK